MNKQGYIYLLENKIGDKKSYKIGFTKNIDKRIKQLQTGNPGEIKVIKSFKTKWGRILESTIHRIYTNDRIKNEWFDLNKEQIDNFLNKCQTSENNINIIKDNYFFKNKYKL